jgi:hypothetical protein
MRFLRSGKNWEGRSFVVNDAIHFLAAQIEEAWPERHPSDGTVASKQHDATSPNSDHRPYPYNGSGIVYALDMGEVTEDDGALLCEELRRAKDSRLRYVIHEERIFASYSTTSRKAWEWGPYTGANPHTNHVHVSVNHTAGPGTWEIRLGEEMPFSDQEVHELKAFVREVLGAGSNMGFVPPLIEKIRAGIVTNDQLGRALIRIGELEREASLQAEEIAALKGRVQALENQSGAGPHHHDSRYPRLGQQYRIG